jgi:hypothetical protein
VLSIFLPAVAIVEQQGKAESFVQGSHAMAGALTQHVSTASAALWFYNACLLQSMSLIEAAGQRLTTQWCVPTCVCMEYTACCFCCCGCRSAALLLPMDEYV